MKNNYSLLFALLLTISSTAQNINFNWVRTVPGGAGGNNTGASIARDKWGNLYVTGTIGGASATIGDSVLFINGQTDVFLTKYDAQGNVLWVRSAGSGGYDYGLAVATDSSGNVYIAGTFAQSPMIFDGDTIDNSGSGDQMFIAKYNTSGQIQWARTSNATSINRTYYLAVDAAGNAYISGLYLGSNLTFGSTVLPPVSGTGALFVVKYNTDGIVQWATAADGNSYDRAYSIATDDAGNVYVAGSFFSQTLAFLNGDTIHHNITGGGNIFLARFSAAGQFIWAKGATGGGEALAVCTGKPNEIYLTGFFTDTLGFGSTLITGGPHDIFALKMDSLGNAQWIKHAASNLWDYGYAIASNKHDRVYVAGTFATGTLSFDGQVINKNGTGSSTNVDLFTAAYDSAGNIQWVRSAGASNVEQLNGVVAGEGNDVFVTGMIESPTFNAGTIPVTSTGHDVFVAKIGDAPNAINETSGAEPLLAYPNPNNGNFYVALPAGAKQLDVTDLTGRIIETVQSPANLISVSITAPGIYLVHVVTANGTATRKIIVGK